MMDEPELTVRAAQRQVDAWISRHEAGYWPPLANLARLIEETGELARLLNHLEGHKPKKPGEAEQDLAMELADILYTLICLANTHAVDLEDAFRRVMRKVETRDAARYARKGGAMSSHILVNPLRPDVLPSYLAAQQDPCAAPAGATLVSQTAHAAVYSVGADPASANAIAGSVEADYTALGGIFGLQPPGIPFTVYVQPNVGGAYHCGCDATVFFVDADPQLGASFDAAEMVEVFEAAIANGWDCGATNGEALSRALAVALHPELGPAMAPTETAWWNDGAGDYVSSNRADDRDTDGNGCGLLFLYYLHDSLGQGWDAIARAGGASLADTYATLTGDGAANAFTAFLQALQPFVDASQNLALPPNGNPFAGVTGA